MLTQEMLNILSTSKNHGWVLEPDAKKLLSLAGLDTTDFIWTGSLKEAQDFAHKIGYPVVAKVVSPRIIHKSEFSGVVTNITDEHQLSLAFERLMKIDESSGSVIVEGSIKGTELIIGAKNDDQFGPVILCGTGGTAVEIYKDVAIRMAPVSESDVMSMIDSLKAHQLLEGYRGSEPVNKNSLTALLIRFSNVVIDLESYIESIDLNPVICSSQRCIIADARIILKT